MSYATKSNVKKIFKKTIIKLKTHKGGRQQKEVAGKKQQQRELQIIFFLPVQKFLAPVAALSESASPRALSALCRSVAVSSSPALRALFFLCTFSLFSLSQCRLLNNARSFVCIFVCLFRPTVRRRRRRRVALVYFTVLSAFVCVCVCIKCRQTPICCCCCCCYREVRAAAVGAAVAVDAAAAAAALACRLLHPLFISYVSWTHM